MKKLIVLMFAMLIFSAVGSSISPGERIDHGLGIAPYAGQMDVQVNAVITPMEILQYQAPAEYPVFITLLSVPRSDGFMISCKSEADLYGNARKFLLYNVTDRNWQRGNILRHDMQSQRCTKNRV